MDYSTPLRSARHEQFAQFISNGENAKTAYILAGYSEHSAEQNSSRLIRNDEVLGRIEFLRLEKEKLHQVAVKNVIEASGINKEWIINELIDNVKIAKAAEPVRDGEGNPTGEYRTNIPAANKALELLGSELGMFVKKIESGKPGDFERMSDDELERRLNENAEAIRLAQTAIRTASNPAGTTQKKLKA